MALLAYGLRVAVILPTTAGPFSRLNAWGIVNNGQTWQAGIVIRHDAIEGTDGTTGFGAAINLSTRHILGWYGEGGGNGER